jgi:Fe-S cluster assembly iron-binding protein IscA
MLTVTENAKQYLKDTLLAHSSDPDVGLRLTLEPPRQFGLMLDSVGIGDHVVEHEGSKVLLVTPELVTLLNEVTIDTKDTPEGLKKLMISKE